MNRIKRLENTVKIQDIWGKYSTVAILVALTVIFNLLGQESWPLESYENIIASNAGVMLTVVGLSFIMIGGGIDLSIGYQISTVAVVISLLSMEKLPDWVVIVGALLVGVCCGLLNGILVGFLEIVPFAATIATQIIFRGISFVLSSGRMVSYIAATVRQIARTYFLGIRIDIWLVIVGFLLLWFVLRYSYVGKYLRAVGLNEAAAIRARVKVKGIKCLSYCVASLFYSVAAMVMVSRRGYAGSEIGVGMEITAIVAAYVGGILSMAEKQSVVTLFLGTLVVAVIENGLTKIGMNTSVQYIITGIILIISMTLHKRQKKA